MFPGANFWVRLARCWQVALSQSEMRTTLTACGGTSIGDKGSLAAAAILAAVGCELLTEPELRTKAKEELKRRLDGRKYQAVQNMELGDLQEVSVRCQKGMGDEYVRGGAVR
jgi:hypothetical protein